MPDTVVRLPKGYGILRNGRVYGYVEGVMPAQTLEQMTGKTTTQYQLPSYVGPTVRPPIRPGLISVRRGYGPIITSRKFVPLRAPFRVRYSVG